MPREIRMRRLTRPADGRASSQDGSDSATENPSFVSLLAGTPRIVDLVPVLHQRAVETAGGTCSLLFEYNPRNGALQATSGSGLDELRTDPWLPSPEERDLVAGVFARHSATLVPNADRQAPDLSSRLNTPSLLLVPLSQGGRRVGLLAIGFPSAPTTASSIGDLTDIGDAFTVALELFRHRQREDLQRDLAELSEEFSAGLASTLNISSALDIFCHGASRLFGADRTSVWIHDRRARQLVLKASSDPEHLSRGVRVSVDDGLAAAAVAMRRIRADILPFGEQSSTSMVAVPLRGTRRALGAIIFDGVRIETGGELDLLDRADEIGRQLSNGIENMQLLDDVMRSRRELENTFDSIAHLVVVSDRRGRIVHANEPFARRVNRTRDELLERPLSDYIGPELAAWLVEHEQSPVRHEGDTPSTCEIVDPVLNGPFMVTVTDLLDKDRERVGSVIVARDLTPQSRLEAEREELRKRLTQSEKLAALGQFVAGIAHELNNPLQGVLGHLELLRATGAFPKQLRREVQTIYREADRAAKIVRNLLVFAGSKRLALRSVSLNVVLQRVLALRQAACRAQDIEVVRHYDEKLPRVLSDPLLLHQVFLNMVMNAEQAVAATGRSGRIEVATSVSEARDRIVATVRDTGGGIPAGALTRIFEPFYTTKEVGKGTGLGLAIAYGIVLEHGGQISAANHPEGGAVFTVELPTLPAAGRRKR
jgi:signal transduction histidine kinase